MIVNALHEGQDTKLLLLGYLFGKLTSRLRNVVRFKIY
jgi:hypothetical protein